MTAGIVFDGTSLRYMADAECELWLAHRLPDHLVVIVKPDFHRPTIPCETGNETHKEKAMWCDTFDMDLLKVIPGATELLADVGTISLKTHGEPDKRDGRLNHPSCWNHYAGMVAFFGFDSPCKPDSFYTNAPVIECTFAEAIRDAWVHSLAVVVEGKVVWNATKLHLVFMDILYAERKIIGDVNSQEIQQHKAYVLECLREGCELFRKIAKDRGNGFP